MGEDLSPCSRAAACADFGSGVGNPLRFTHATGINADVTIALHRHPIGEWVCLESGSWVNPHGVGLAETRLHDERGPIGRAVQTLLLESMQPATEPDGQRAGRRPRQRNRMPRTVAYVRSVVVGVALDVGGPQLELAVAEHEHHRPPASGGRRSPRLLSTRTAIVRRPEAVSIVTRSEAST